MRHRYHYIHMEKYGYKKVGQYLLLQCLSHKYQTSSLGITLSKKYGKAHDRNFFKRRIREMFRTNKVLLPQGYMFHIKPLYKADQHVCFQLLQEEFIMLAQQIVALKYADRNLDA